MAHGWLTVVAITTVPLILQTQILQFQSSCQYFRTAAPGITPNSSHNCHESQVGIKFPVSLETLTLAFTANDKPQARSLQYNQNHEP